MIWLKWFPWRFIVRRIARAHGFLDPIALLARLRRFAQPSEVHEPIELLRAGVVLHARGLLNNRILQHNLDWLFSFPGRGMGFQWRGPMDHIPVLPAYRPSPQGQLVEIHSTRRPLDL